MSAQWPELDDDTVERIFETDIVQELGRYRAMPTAEPELVVLGGQPGSGKSSSVWLFEDEFARRGRLVPLVGDDLRRFHPGYLRVLADDDVGLAPVTQQAAVWWVRRATAWCLEQRLNILIEATLRKGEQTFSAATAQRFADAGYRVRVVALAVSGLISKIGIVDRYVRQRAHGGGALWTSVAAHNRPYMEMPETLRRLESSPVVDRMVVRTRRHVVHDNTRDRDGRWSTSQSPADVLTAERDRPLSADDLADLHRYVAQLKGRLIQADRADHPAIRAMLASVDHELDLSSRTTAARAALDKPSGPADLGLDL